MDDVDQSIASQNAIVLAIGGKLKTLHAGIVTSKQKGENTLLTEITPIVKGINKNVDIIRKMLAEAKNIKKAWATAKNQLDALVTEKAATFATLTKKDEEIAVMTDRLKKNEDAAVENHQKLTNQKTALEAANQANLTAKENVEAGLAKLQQQSAAATQQQQAALQEAMAAKAAAEGQQQQAAREVAQTKADLGTSQQHAAKMQAHMAKLGDLKKHQAGLTAALNALNAEIEAANDDMRSLDAAHVDHLGAIKTQLQTLDEELRRIIEADPGAAGSGGPGMGPGPGAAGSGDRPTEDQRRIAAILDTDRVRPGTSAAGSGDSGTGPRPSAYTTRVQGQGSVTDHIPPHTPDDIGNESSDVDDEDMPTWARRGNPRQLQPSGPHVKEEDVDTDDEPAMIMPQPRGVAGGEHNVVATEVDRINHHQPPRAHHATTAAEDELLDAGVRGSKSSPGPFAKSVPRKYRGGGRRTRKQRGGYIAIKKTRSKSSSSSGRRGTRRSSSSRSKSTRRRRHRSSSRSSR
jgi:hypothetical protein